MKERFKDLTAHRPTIQTEQQLDQEIQMETLNAYLLASNEVISGLTEFMYTPDFDKYYTVANAMRKDLWGNAKDLKMEVFYAD